MTGLSEELVRQAPRSRHCACQATWPDEEGGPVYRREIGRQEEHHKTALVWWNTVAQTGYDAQNTTPALLTTGFRAAVKASRGKQGPRTSVWWGWKNWTGAGDGPAES